MLLKVIFVICIAIVLLLLITRVRLRISIRDGDIHQSLAIYCNLNGTILAIPLWHSYPFPLFTPRNDIQTASDENHLRAAIGKRTEEIILALLPQAIMRLEGTIRIGTGDAAETGFVVGLAYQIISWLRVVLKSFVKRSSFNVEIEPDFDNFCFCPTLILSISVSLRHIIKSMVNTNHNTKSQTNEGGKIEWQTILFKG